MAKKKPNKIPPRRVYADDLTIIQDGEEYHPHAGEWVDVRGSTSLASMRLITRVQHLQGMGSEDMTAEDIQELDEAIVSLTQYVSGLIAGWNWTDDEGNKYPSPPTAEIIEHLRVEEMWWLMSATREDRTEEQAKNG